MNSEKAEPRYPKLTVEWIEPARLHTLSGNPQETRCNANDPAFLALFHHIAYDRQWSPIIVDRKTMTVMEGHRRLAVAIVLKRKVLVMFVDDLESHKVWIDGNETNKPLNGRSDLEAYLKDDRLVRSRNIRSLDKASQLCGKAALWDFYIKGGSVNGIRESLSLFRKLFILWNSIRLEDVLKAYQTGIVKDYHRGRVAEERLIELIEAIKEMQTKGQPAPVQSSRVN